MSQPSGGSGLRITAHVLCELRYRVGKYVVKSTIIEGDRDTFSSPRTQQGESKDPTVALCYFIWPDHIKTGTDVLIMNKSSGQK